ncbi:MAG: hypothetical protein HXY20_07085 [Acidobacteria bacterium]|nr:hypothetical protein [Acidobacteriota bacterium]
MRMKKVVERERNKTCYRVLHLPIWVWVFFILPGHLTYDLYVHGPDWRHAWWLATVAAVCAWRGLAGRLPGVEPKPYVTHYGVDKPNVPYRVVCYTAAWIDLLVPFSLNFLGVVYANIAGRWALGDLYTWLYYPLALVVVIATVLDMIPRARRSTVNEGAEKAWFYVAVWVVVPTQVVSWAAWRLGGGLGLGPPHLARLRLLIPCAVACATLYLALRGVLPRTRRYYAVPEDESGGSMGQLEQVRDA